MFFINKIEVTSSKFKQHAKYYIVPLKFMSIMTYFNISLPSMMVFTTVRTNVANVVLIIKKHVTRDEKQQQTNQYPLRGVVFVSQNQTV